MLPLIKVLWIFISTTGLWVTLTPPQPPPAENEETEMTVLEAILRRRYILFTIKVSCKDIEFETVTEAIDLFGSAALSVSLLLRRRSLLPSMHSTTNTLTPVLYSPISFFRMALRNIYVSLGRFLSALW